jgi:hypothetical protein
MPYHDHSYRASVVVAPILKYVSTSCLAKDKESLFREPAIPAADSSIALDFSIPFTMPV